MLFIRSLIFNIFFIVWTLFIGVLFLPFIIFSNRITQLTSYFWAAITLKTANIICGIKYKVEGIENISKDEAIIASKHESTWDTILFLYLFKNPIFILKKELIFIPIFGLYLIRGGMIYINRSKGAKAIKLIVKKSQKILKNKRKLVIFPQGTRTLANEYKKYQSGIFAIAVKNNSTVIPVVLNSSNCWAKKSFIKKSGIITVKFLSPIIATEKKKFMKDLENNMELNYKDLQ